MVFFSVSTLASDFLNVTYRTYCDGDACKMSIAVLPDLFTHHMTIRLEGIDTAESKGKCEQEKWLTREVRDFIRPRLERAKVIH